MTANGVQPRTIELLLVEDDPRVVSALRDGFENRGVNLRHAGDLATAEKMLTEELPCDVIVLDLNLPDGNGLDFARSRRRLGCGIPIIMVTARDAIKDRVLGLREGADDYLCKPFAVEELLARVGALMRRTGSGREHVLRYGDIELDLMKRELRRGGISATLSMRELDLLSFLMSHAEEVLDKGRILREVWGDDAEHDENVLQVYTNYLRNKLEQGVAPRVIHTVRGVGYVLASQPPMC